MRFFCRDNLVTRWKAKKSNSRSQLSFSPCAFSIFISNTSNNSILLFVFFTKKLCSFLSILKRHNQEWIYGSMDLGFSRGEGTGFQNFFKNSDDIFYRSTKLILRALLAAVFASMRKKNVKTSVMNFVWVKNFFTLKQIPLTFNS